MICLALKTSNFHALGRRACRARQMALQLLENLRQQQSSAFAYFDTFFVFAVLSIPLVAFVFMMKRSVAQKGAHTAAK